MLKKTLSQPCQDPSMREREQATAMEMEQEQSPGAVPAGFSSTWTQGEEDED